METREVTDPLEVMAPLVDFRPDLILMDVYMPGCNGSEIAAVIRQQEAYVGIPIMFFEFGAGHRQTIGSDAPGRRRVSAKAGAAAATWYRRYGRAPPAPAFCKT